METFDSCMEFIKTIENRGKLLNRSDLQISYFNTLETIKKCKFITVGEVLSLYTYLFDDNDSYVIIMDYNGKHIDRNYVIKSTKYSKKEYLLFKEHIRNINKKRLLADFNNIKSVCIFKMTI